MEYDPVECLEIRPHKERSHIEIIDKSACHRCESKACTLVCPTGVFYWKDGLDIKYWRCLECGACEVTCSKIEWSFPTPPYGVSYRKN